MLTLLNQHMFLSEINIKGKSGDYKHFSFSEKGGRIIYRDPYAVLCSVKTVFCMIGSENCEEEFSAVAVNRLGKCIISSSDISPLWQEEIRRCEEDDHCCVFDFLDMPNVEDRFEVYRSPEVYMARRQFERVTGGTATTNTFRTIMREVEREFPINKETVSDSVLRSYLYFLRTALFWDRFNLIRNPYHEGKPLIVLNVPDEVPKNRDLFVRPDRQIILIG